MKVYLSGPIAYTPHEEAYGWREDLKVAILWEWPQAIVVIPEPFGYSTANHVVLVDGDKDDIETSDFVIAYLYKPSFGTAMELYHAWMREVRIIGVAPDPRIREHPWLRYHVAVLVPSFEEALTVLRKLNVR